MEVLESIIDYIVVSQCRMKGMVGTTVDLGLCVVFTSYQGLVIRTPRFAAVVLSEISF